MTTKTRHRTLADWLLVLEGMFFLAQFGLFFAYALRLGVQPKGLKFIILAVATFVTAFSAGMSFARRTDHPVLVFFGLLLLQPAASALANAFADQAVNLAIPAVASLLAFAMFVGAARPPGATAPAAKTTLPVRQFPTTKTAASASAASKTNTVPRGH